MQLCYNPVVKAKTAEVTALGNLAGNIAGRVLPLFEVDRPPIKPPKYMTASQTPTITYLDRVVDLLGSLHWQGPVMVDTYQWPANAQVETGANVISYVVATLRGQGATVIPVVGYDRWENLEYREALKNLPLGPGGKVAIRLDTFAISDASEPELLQATVSDILETLAIQPSQCAIVIDFGDVSGATGSVIEIFDDSSRVINVLAGFGFEYFSVAGCSLPPSIDQAVPERDADAPVLRKEMVAWQMLREHYPDLVIVNSDYCVRGPTSTSAPVKHINGKIRYAVPRNHLVVRGHSRIIDGSFIQMYELAGRLVASGQFLGAEFSWGDGEVVLAADHEGGCGPTTWIAIDTNHHITHAVHEVLEFEGVLAAREYIKSIA